MALIRDNVIVDTKGPGIMVYGAQDLSTVSLVERNFVMGSLGSSGIVVGGGPVVVRNNVAVASQEGGIGLEDYGRRGLLRGIVVAHNTVFGNLAGGIVTPEGGVRDALLVNNAAHGRVGAPALPPARNGVRLAGNRNCLLLACFMNPEARDFSPLLGTGLVGAGAVRVAPWMPRDDYLGNRRVLPPTVGALERPGGPIPLAPKP